MPTSVAQPEEKRQRGALVTAVRAKYAPSVLALTIFLIAIVATAFAWQFARTELENSQHAEFAFQARQMERRIEQRMGNYEQVQRGTQAFLLGSMKVERKDFRDYIASLRLEETYPGIQGIALVELLAAGELDAHNAAQRRESPGYTVHPLGERAVLSAITQIEPFSGLNLRALGFDMLSEPTRRAAMERARDTGQSAASGKVRLIQENGRNEQAGLVMYLPVYRRDAPAATVAERRANIIGWVGAPFRMDDLMAGLGGERSGDITLSIYDGNAIKDSARLFRSAHETPARVERPARFSAVVRVVVAGRPWTLHMRSAAQFEARLRSDRPQFIAIVGIAAGALLALLVWTLASGRGRAVALAADMTQQLSESEFRWKYALEGAGDGVWDWNRATGEIVHSRRWKEMLGYGVDEIAPTDAAFQALLHDEDRERVLATLNAYVEGTDQAYECQFRLRCKNGTWRWIRSRGMAVTRDAMGHPLRTIGTHTDITRAKADEQTLLEANTRLAAEQRRVSVILDHSHDAFVAVGTDGRHITDWNAKAEAMFGWPAALAIGHDLATLIIPEEMRADHNAGIARVIASGTDHMMRKVVEVTALHRDGRRVPVELAIAGFPQGSGFVVSAFMRDISERKLAEQLEVERSRALEEARHALQHSQKLEAVGKLTGGVAHDFNNVLHVIGGNVQLLQLSNRDDARLQKRLGSIQSAVDRGAKLASQLLAFARRQPLQPVVLNPLQTLQAMDDLLQRALGESVRISIDADDRLWNTLVDPGQWENVVMNLAINARDAMPGGGVLTIGLRNETVDAGHAGALDLAPGDYIRFSFADTGQGMDAEVMAHAFEPFFTTKPVGQGTGLGLSMAYGFVKQSGGHIMLDSGIGKGTTVIIYLPRSAQRAIGKAGAAEQNVVGGGETVLVVEDDAEVRATTVATLNELGYCVLEAHDGASALALLRKGAWVDLVFTDVVMPGPVSSIELAMLAQRELPGVAVLYTSGYTRDALTTGGTLDDGVRLLGKPYRRAQLAQHVRDALASRMLGS